MCQNFTPSTTEKGRTKQLIKAIKDKNVERVKILLDKGVNINYKDDDDKSLLTFACYTGNIQIIRMLIDAGCDVNYDNGWDRPPLLEFIAQLSECNDQAVELVRLMIAKGADVNYLNYEGNSVLFFAAKENFYRIVELLLDAGADLNYANEWNWNALMQAVFYDAYDVAKLLLERGIRTDLIDKQWGETAYSLAKKRASDKLCELLEKYNVTNRTIKKRKKGQRYLKIYECDICNYLPAFAYMEHSYYQRYFSQLETIAGDSEEPDRFTTVSHTVYKCPNCGTFYYHYHYVDLEDAFVSGGDISQHFYRLTFEVAKQILKHLNKKTELLAYEKRIEKLISDFEQNLTKITIDTTVIDFVIQNLVDYYFLHQDFEKLKNILLLNDNQIIAKKTVQMIKETKNKRFAKIYPSNEDDRIYTEKILEMKKKLLEAHKEEYREIIKRIK
jgi:hypothetical protein